MTLLKRIQALKEKALAIMITSIAGLSHMDAKDVKIFELDNDVDKSGEENKKLLKWTAPKKLDTF